MSEPILSYNGISVGDTVICKENCVGKSAPVLGEAYRVAKFTKQCGTIFLWPAGLDDGWRVDVFEKADGFMPHDLVRCVDGQDSTPRLVVGMLYEVKQTYWPGSDRVYLIGVPSMAGFYARRFVLVRRPRVATTSACAEIPAEDGADWKSAYEATVSASMGAMKADLLAALERERALRKEVETTRADLATARTRLEVLRKDRDLVVDEHKRMKRQLELAESYNFDRKGLSDNEVIRDLYNYALVGLGKKPLDLYDWMLQRIKSAMATVQGPWKPPVFDAALPVLDRITYHYSWPLAVSYIPIGIVITDEKPSHQSDAYSPTGCGEGCSHPDCKKATK